MAKLNDNDDDLENLFTAYRTYKEKYTLSKMTKYVVKYQLLNPLEADEDRDPKYLLLHSEFLHQIEKFAKYTGKIAFDAKPSYSKLRKVL